MLHVLSSGDGNILGCLCGNSSDEHQSSKNRKLLTIVTDQNSVMRSLWGIIKTKKLEFVLQLEKGYNAPLTFIPVCHF